MADESSFPGPTGARGIPGAAGVPRGIGATGAPAPTQVAQSGGAPPQPQIKSTPTPPAVRRSRAGGSIHETISGVRRVKAYPVTRDELLGLGGVGIVTTFCFSVGSSYIKRSFDIHKDLEFNQQLPSDLIVKWQTTEMDDWLFGFFFFAIGVLAFILGGAKIFSIMRSTEHPS
jgi:hypothetical protein